MPERRPWYVEERAEHLAVVYLTRRSDLVVQRVYGLDYGFDILVYLTKSNRLTKQVFGVEVKGRRSLRAKRNSRTNDYYFPDIHFTAHEQSAKMPVCVFLFSMETDEGYFKWLIEPTLTKGRMPRLRLNRKNHYKKLDTAALDYIIDEVNRWYKAK